MSEEREIDENIDVWMELDFSEKKTDIGNKLNEYNDIEIFLKENGGDVTVLFLLAHEIIQYYIEEIFTEKLVREFENSDINRSCIADQISENKRVSLLGHFNLLENEGLEIIRDVNECRRNLAHSPPKRIFPDEWDLESNTIGDIEDFRDLLDSVSDAIGDLQDKTGNCSHEDFKFALLKPEEKEIHSSWDHFYLDSGKEDTAILVSGRCENCGSINLMRGFLEQVEIVDEEPTRKSLHSMNESQYCWNCDEELEVSVLFEENGIGDFHAYSLDEFSSFRYESGIEHLLNLMD
jgi:hypothetical protein